MFGFYRFAAAVPRTLVGDVTQNVVEILDLWKKTGEGEVQVTVFPELCVSGHSCGDLFGQKQLLSSVITGIERLVSASLGRQDLLVIGAPVESLGRLYNCAVIIQAGNILGVVPKSYLPNYREHYEKRWFAAAEHNQQKSILLAGQTVKFGTDLLFRLSPQCLFGVEICEDLWNVIPPSSYHCIAGASVTLNLSASPEHVGKATYRKSLVSSQSARCLSGYVYCSAGVSESTTDVVYGGHALIAENGTLLAENRRFNQDSHFIFADIDVEKLGSLRRVESSFQDLKTSEFRIINAGKTRDIKNIARSVNPHPFIPTSSKQRDERFSEILEIQSCGLAKRIRHVKVKKLVIGVSGGLDSTLALLVCLEAKAIVGDSVDILGLTMPGPGTSARTRKNAKTLCKELGVACREIAITDACEKHLKDIEYKGTRDDTTFENVQARERTQILMDIANAEDGLVVGTGDLSEIALGWSTYSGDHISMYNVNCGVPKTLVTHLVRWLGAKGKSALKTVLEDILATPISPELIAKEKGEMQETEKIVGPYELHDFFLYYFMRYGFEPDKIRFLAQKAFGDTYKNQELNQWLKVFIQRFFANQFKRSCLPDGPKVGTIALSPRGDWRMPSDASAKEWLRSIEEVH